MSSPPDESPARVFWGEAMIRSQSSRVSRVRRAGICLVLLGLLSPALANAQDATGPSDPPRNSGSRFSMRASLGMTASPETVNMTLEVPWAADDLVSVGPLFQLGFSDDNVLFASTLQAYLTPRLEGELADWYPYAHMGMGLIYLENDDRAPGRDEEDAAFLFTVGTGIEYSLSDSFTLGTGFLFDVIPGGAVGDRFVFGWQILTFRTEF